MESYDLDQHDEDVTLLVHAWPDIEAAILDEAERERAMVGLEHALSMRLVDALRHAMRVEVQEQPHEVAEFNYVGISLGYVLLFNVASYEAREAAIVVRDERDRIDSEARRLPTQGNVHATRVVVVPFGKPVEGEVCPRVMAPEPGAIELVDLPEPEPPPSDVPYVKRGVHKLTPIEAPFYDAMKATTELTFAVQPRVQGPDQIYRPDFIVFYGGRGVVVEIDGHEGHKSREQRSHDLARERWFQERRIQVVRFTGSQVRADAAVCVEELLAVLRGASARP